VRAASASVGGLSIFERFASAICTDYCNCGKLFAYAPAPLPQTSVFGRFRHVRLHRISAMALPVSEVCSECSLIA
jgi:hypothetical protein